MFTVHGDIRTKFTRHVGALADVLDRLLERTLNEPSIGNSGVKLIGNGVTEVQASFKELAT